MLHPYVGTEHLLIGILRVEAASAGRILAAARLQRLRRARGDDLASSRSARSRKQKKELPFLAEYSRDLTQLAADRQPSIR